MLVEAFSKVENGWLLRGGMPNVIHLELGGLVMEQLKGQQLFFFPPFFHGVYFSLEVCGGGKLVGLD